MLVQVVGCSHHGTSIALRERLAFSEEQAREALDRWRRVFPRVESVLLSTCNRVEIYSATDQENEPSFEQVAAYLARFHGLEPDEVAQQLYRHSDEAAVRHLFTVASSLDSMVLGEPQILAQVKQAYQLASQQDNTGPLMHAIFQTALHVARRVANETAIHQRRVSVPSVAVADFARQVFERFDDKEILVIGAGAMAQETLLYLEEEGARRITVVNRHFQRAAELADRWKGRAMDWDDLPQALAAADVVVSTAAAGHWIVDCGQFVQIEALRFARPLFILDLAVPRDFDPAIGDRPDVYLYSIDDLQAVCQQNRVERDKELPAALHIIDQETARFMAELYHRAIGPVIEQLRLGWQAPKEEELQRLLHKLPDIDDHARDEIRHAFDRLVNKLLHPPLMSLRDESSKGIPRGLLDALARLFQLKRRE
jgi:glutamyl-tRNA reductase